MAETETETETESDEFELLYDNILKDNLSEAYEFLDRKNSEEEGVKDTDEKYLKAFCLALYGNDISFAENELLDRFSLHTDSCMHMAILYAILGGKYATLRWVFEELYSGVFHYDIYNLEQSYLLQGNPINYMLYQSLNGDSSIETNVPIPAVLLAARLGYRDMVKLLLDKQIDAMKEHRITTPPSRHLVMQVCYELIHTHYLEDPDHYEEVSLDELLYMLIFELKHEGAPKTLTGFAKEEESPPLLGYYQQVLCEVFGLAIAYAHNDNAFILDVLYKFYPPTIDECLESIPEDLLEASSDRSAIHSWVRDRLRRDDSPLSEEREREVTHISRPAKATSMKEFDRLFVTFAMGLPDIGKGCQLRHTFNDKKRK
jgi:hypothetical protein